MECLLDFLSQHSDSLGLVGTHTSEYALSSKQDIVAKIVSTKTFGISH